MKKALERRVKAEKKSNENDLDSYLAELKIGAQVDKETVTKLKVRIQNLTSEKDRLVKLIKIAKPASMPELKTSSTAKQQSGLKIGEKGSKGLLGKVKSVAKDSFAKPVAVQSENTKVLEVFLEKDEEVSKINLSKDSGREEAKRNVGVIEGGEEVNHHGATAATGVCGAPSSSQCTSIPSIPLQRSPWEVCCGALGISREPVTVFTCNARHEASEEDLEIARYSSKHF